MDKCPWCNTELKESEVKKSLNGEKYITRYCPNKNCSRGFESDKKL
jgi:hypothetical protein